MSYILPELLHICQVDTSRTTSEPTMLHYTFFLPTRLRSESKFQAQLRFNPSFVFFFFFSHTYVTDSSWICAMNYISIYSACYISQKDGIFPSRINNAIIASCVLSENDRVISHVLMIKSDEMRLVSASKTRKIDGVRNITPRFCVAAPVSFASCKLIAGSIWQAIQLTLIISPFSTGYWFKWWLSLRSSRSSSRSNQAQCPSYPPTQSWSHGEYLQWS